MKHLLNTLFVTSENIYLSLEGENVIVNKDNQVMARYPLHTLQSIISFSYSGTSTALMGACASKGISLSFCTPRGKFLARICGANSGNVLLRREQYRIADDPERSCLISRNMILGKIYNSRWSIERTKRDHGIRLDGPGLAAASQELRQLLPLIANAETQEVLRGLEGAGATIYFGVLDEMILREKDSFSFAGEIAGHHWIV